MRVVLIAILFILVGCQSETEKYELIRFGKSQKKIHPNDAVLIKMAEETEELYVIISPDETEKVFELLMELGIGDLIELKEQFGGLNKGLQIEIIDAREKDYIRAMMKGFNEFQTSEDLDLARYIFNANEEYEFIWGMYVYKKELSKSGKRGIKNSLYKVAMECELLSGKEVYSTAKSSTLFEFNKSMPGQITEGLGIVMDKMEEGDEYVVIIPSKMSFGEVGVEGLVPPNSPLKYELKLIEIII